MFGNLQYVGVNHVIQDPNFACKFFDLASILVNPRVQFTMEIFLGGS